MFQKYVVNDKRLHYWILQL